MLIAKIVEKIKTLDRQRILLIKHMLKVKEMVKGSYGETFRKCGNPNCWCAKDRGHPLCRIVWSDNGKIRTKSIPKDDIDWIKSVTKKYQTFRKFRQKFRALEIKIKEQTNRYEKAVIVKTNRLRDYLD